MPLRGGLIGRVCYVLIIVAIALAAIAWSVRNVWVSAAMGGMAFVLAFVLLWRIISLAQKYPQIVLLEGSDFLIYQQMTQGSKAHPILPDGPKEVSSRVAANPALALEPDRPSSPQLPNEGQGGGANG